ncbi:MAG: hypothetical protein NTZ63_03775 [Candidatus Omnitrophica bacterium]|nr:hypothetical protein [Candidatus Omnitrophota bacterium]
MKTLKVNLADIFLSVCFSVVMCLSFVSFIYAEGSYNDEPEQSSQSYQQPAAVSYQDNSSAYNYAPTYNNTPNNTPDLSNISNSLIMQPSSNYPGIDSANTQVLGSSVNQPANAVVQNFVTNQFSGADVGQAIGPAATLNDSTGSSYPGMGGFSLMVTEGTPVGNTNLVNDINIPSGNDIIVNNMIADAAREGGPQFITKEMLSDPAALEMLSKAWSPNASNLSSEVQPFTKNTPVATNDWSEMQLTPMYDNSPGISAPVEVDNIINQTKEVLNNSALSGSENLIPWSESKQYTSPESDIFPLGTAPQENLIYKVLEPIEIPYQIQASPVEKQREIIQEAPAQEITTSSYPGLAGFVISSMVTEAGDINTNGEINPNRGPIHLDSNNGNWETNEEDQRAIDYYFHNDYIDNGKNAGIESTPVLKDTMPGMSIESSIVPKDANPGVSEAGQAIGPSAQQGFQGFDTAGWVRIDNEGNLRNSQGMITGHTTERLIVLPKGE